MQRYKLKRYVNCPRYDNFLRGCNMMCRQCTVPYSDRAKVYSGTTVVNINNEEEYDVLIDRTTEWGNPTEIDLKKGITRLDAIKNYYEYLMAKRDLLKKLPTLMGKRLGCHCKPEFCHGDIIVMFIEKSVYKI